MKFLKDRVLPFVCAFSIIVSLCVVPASAVAFPDAYRDTGSVDDIDTLFLSNYVAEGFEVVSDLSQGVLDTPSEIFWSYVNKQVQTVGEVDMARLKTICQGYNSVFNTTLGDNFFSHAQNMADEIAMYTFAYTFFGVWGLTFSVERHPSSGLLRIYCPELDWWVTNSAGAYPYVDTNLSGSGGSQWLPFDMVYSDIRNDSAKIALVDYSVLSAVCADFIADGIPCRIASVSTKYKGIVTTDGESIYGNESGYPYLCWADSSQTATEQERPPTTVVENGVVVEGDVTDNSTNINLDGMTVTLPDGSINFIDKIIYDESTKSYHIDSHDTYNYTQNNYYTWNYYINYTSITYIGQTEEYNKYYEVYYELPDGRDSADLTKEDLEQLNLSIDVIPYGRSADDTSLRSLYHFDGDTKDSSYWNYCTDFTWNTGASLTYMDAGVFDGALYLDEKEHDFSMKLPSNVTSADFTLQFRYYQSATAAPQTDSYVKIGDTTIMQFNGGSFLNSGGSALAETPVGSWNEVAMMRANGIVYYYLNGVCIGSAGIPDALSDTITFHFGSAQQTFKYFDELRFLNYALQSGGANYEPTSVPHDTNLTLVLPSNSVAVADEYWSITSSGNNLLSCELDDFTSGIAPSWYSNIDNSFPYFASCDPYGGDATLYGRLEAYSGFLRIINNGGSLSYTEAYGFHAPFQTRLCSWTSDLVGTTGSFVFSVVLADGTVCSLSFNHIFPPSSRNRNTNASAVFDWGTLAFVTSGGSSDDLCYLAVLPNTSVDIIYMELVSGSSTDLTAEWVESVTVMDEENFHTPTLAVRTDIDITSYQIGGVRPSVPTKGQVWALVENERITSIQIYNGQAWEGVDGRIWTGSRWIPASSYNIVTLQDMYDIVDATPDFEYIYTESGFWSWWQKSWNAFTEKLFKVLGSGGTGAAGGCQHAYAITAETDATCTDPGERTYTCALCDNQYVESVPALGHDWIQKEETPTTYALPEGTACPDCAGLDYAAELDEDSATYSCSCNSCGTVWTVQAEVTEGETLYTCSRCGETTTGTDKENEGFFDALGNFLADGVEWVTDKLKQLVDSLDGLNKIFSDYVTTIREKAGDYPAFLSAAIAFMPEDLMAVFWFSVVAFVLLAVWKKWLR